MSRHKNGGDTEQAVVCMLQISAIDGKAHSPANKLFRGSAVWLCSFVGVEQSYSIFTGVYSMGVGQVRCRIVITQGIASWRLQYVRSLTL